MTAPHQLSAVEARRLIVAGELSPVELVDACLARVEAVDPAVNAMVTRAGERARAEARVAAEAVAHARRAATGGAAGAGETGGGGELGLLHGLPVAIKDLQATEGIVTTLGAADLADHVPTADSGIVARVRAAGGIVVGKTNIPERSIGANTVNRLFGATGNPFDPDRTCGGSSGGSAVAVATDMVPLATGSDHGGSLRIPACYCGVVGHRATPGVVPFEERTMTQTFYSVQGPMARTVDDTALLLAAITDRSITPASGLGDPMAHPLDHTAFTRLDELDPTELRIGVSEDLGGVLVSAEVRRQFRRRVDRLVAAGVRCVEVPLDLSAAADVDWRVRSDIFATQYHREAETWDDGFNPHVRRSYEAALAASVADIAAARRTQMELYQHTRATLGGLDAIVCPGVSVAPFDWRQLNPVEVDGTPVENYMAWLSLTAAITVVGHPVTALPAGLDDDGLPVGVQVVGHAHGDHRLLGVARALEAVFAAEVSTARPRPDEAVLAREHPALRTDGPLVQLD
ncbi:MAG: amidase [Actinomycetota bacterium]